ncbi:heparinase II/III domain-containing protein [Cerasicoccus maritimus]|uniref:heparinase II/III domain-containing protein n=1 Tax=Cerasicoccus maritimus TaxID=490089 RepID=UPI002852BFF0|nr:heparinase II/III family protein [Cerasicoccus maritimus]
MSLGEANTPQQTLRVSLDIRLFDAGSTATTNAPGFPSYNGGLRFGLYNTNNTEPQADDNAATSDDFGYRVYLPFGTGTANPSIVKETGTQSEILTGSDSIILASTVYANERIEGNHVHSAELMITRIGVQSVEIGIRLFDGPGLTGNLIFESVATDANSAYTDFNLIAIGSSEDVSFRIDNVKCAIGRSRFLLNGAKLQDIRLRYDRGETVIVHLVNRILSAADAYLSPDLAPVTFNNSSPAESLEQSRAAMGRIHVLAFAYLYTDNPEYLDAAIDIMTTVSAFPNWAPSQFLSVAEMSMGVAIGYNWLYEELGASEEIIRNALYQNVLMHAPSVYSPQPVNVVWHAYSWDNNWNPVCNGGMLAASLALKDFYPDLAKATIDALPSSLELYLQHYDQSGVWPEGAVYFSYGGTYTAFILNALESSLGSDSNLGLARGLEFTPAFFAHAFGPSGSVFNFADCGLGKSNILGASGAFLWWAARHGNDAEKLTANQWMGNYADAERAASFNELNSIAGVQNRTDVLNLIWLAREPKNTSTSLPQDICLSDGLSELAFFRDRESGQSALWLGLIAGKNGFHHSHLDKGSFVMESDGVRWAEDLGADSYDLPGYFDYVDGRWDYYRTNNFSHNTLTINGKLQTIDGAGDIVGYISTDSWTHVIVDLSELYPDAAQALRGVAMIDRDESQNTARIIIQDELDGVAGDEIHWGMVTSASINIDGNAKAMLTKDGKQMEARILSPNGASFEIESTQPTTNEENQNNNTRMLAVNYQADQDENFVRLVVLFRPIGYGWKATALPSVTTLSSWPSS